MIENKSLVINNKGMITIPAELRKKYNLQPGTKVTIMEVNGHLELVPVVDITKLRKHQASEFLESIEEARKTEIALENEEKDMP
ncbi:MAG: AbrB/MazE/SpoVT family DNA-binding domain-containing protein [Promethearchaeota archaeon]